MTLPEKKQALRTRLRTALKALSPDRRQAASRSARERLAEQPCWRQAGSVLLFAPMKDELDVWPCLVTALVEGKRVCLPRFETAQNGYAAARVCDPDRDLATGRFGIREPAPHCAPHALKRLDLILVPGLGFDCLGHRLGRGQGYYDRWLAEPCGLTCGVAFDEQVLDALPAEPHDVIVQCILTPSRWIEVSPRREVLD